MKVLHNRITRKDNNKNQTTNLIYDQNSTSVIKKSTKTNSHQIKTNTKPIDLYFIRKDMEPAPNATRQQNDKKRKQISEKFKNTFSVFEKN